MSFLYLRAGLFRSRRDGWAVARCNGIVRKVRALQGEPTPERGGSREVSQPQQKRTATRGKGEKVG